MYFPVIDVGASGAYKMGVMSVGAGSTWKRATGLWVGAGGQWKQAGRLANLQDHAFSTFRTGSGGVYQSIMFSPDGNVYTYTSTTSQSSNPADYTFAYRWLFDGVASDYQVTGRDRVGTTYNTGSTFPSYTTLSADRFYWGNNTFSTVSTLTGSCAFEIRHAASGLTVARCTVTYQRGRTS